MTVTVKLGGLRTLSEGTNDAIDRGTKRGAEFIADLARQFAPYDPTDKDKHLNESIEVQEGPGSGTYRVVAGVGLPDDRAVFQEFGTIFMAAQPYMTPAKEAIDVTAEIKRELQALIARSRV